MLIPVVQTERLCVRKYARHERLLLWSSLWSIQRPTYSWLSLWLHSDMLPSPVKHNIRTGQIWVNYFGTCILKLILYNLYLLCESSVWLEERMNFAVLTELLTVNPAVGKLPQKSHMTETLVAILPTPLIGSSTNLILAVVPCEVTTSHEYAPHTCSLWTPVFLALTH